MATIPLCSLCLDNGGNCLACHEWKKAIAIKDSQLAESAGREVQLRTELTNTRASIESLIAEAETPRGISSYTVATFGDVMIGDIDRALAAHPSTAAAELVLGRAAFEWCSRFPDSQAAKALAVELAAVAAARAGTP